MLVREPGPRYMIQGTSGSFIKYGEDPQEARLRAGELPEGEDWGQEKEDTYGMLNTVINGETIKKKYPSHKGSYAAYYLGLYETIVNGAPLLKDPSMGIILSVLWSWLYRATSKREQFPVQG